MNKEAQSVVVMLLGGLLVGITVSGRFTSYVRPGFGPLLLAAGIILVIVGILSLVAVILGEVRRARTADQRTMVGAATATGQLGDARSSARSDHDGGGAQHPGGADEQELDAHGHSHGNSRAPWLILAPILILLVVSPTALGADAVSRNAGAQGLAGLAPAPPAKTLYEGYKPNDGSGSADSVSSTGRRTLPFDPLPQGNDPVIELKDLVMRALYDGTNSVSNTPVTVVGFITPTGDSYASGYTIARLAISCCAADANPVRIHVNATAPYPVNAWIAVVVTADAGTATAANNYVPTVRVHSIQQVQQPSDPYEH